MKALIKESEEREKAINKAQAQYAAAEAFEKKKNDEMNKAAAAFNANGAGTKEVIDWKKSSEAFANAQEMTKNAKKTLEDLQGAELTPQQIYADNLRKQQQMMMQAIKSQQLTKFYNESTDAFWRYGNNDRENKKYELTKKYREEYSQLNPDDVNAMINYRMAEYDLADLMRNRPSGGDFSVYTNDLASRGGFASSVAVQAKSPEMQILEWVKAMNVTQTEMKQYLGIITNVMEQ